MAPKLSAVTESPPAASIEDEVQRWNAQFLACRSFQHAWEQRTAQYSQRYSYYSVVMACIRCGTTKHQELNGRGLITASWYEYPEGYLSGAGFLDSDARAVVRVANLQAHNLRTLKAGTAPTRKATTL